MLTNSIVAGFAMLSLLGAGPGAFAADAGSIQQLNGSVTITNADNVSRIAGPKERIMSGDTIVTAAKSEALIKMADDSSVIVRANTQFQFTEFKYEKTP